jgi:chorismate-pyruvate lyase
MEVEGVSQPVLPESLQQFLGKSRVAGVVMDWLEPDAVPEPYHRLLVHHGDMTSRLQEFHEEEITLEILQEGRAEEEYLREVVLRGKETGAPVEYGLIEVVLANFTPSMQVAILEGGQPLGGMLVETATEFGSSPLGYFRVPATAVGDIYSETPGGEVLYGRYNQLLGEDGACLARIIEILPCVQES